MSSSYFLAVNDFESPHFITASTTDKLDLLSWLNSQQIYPKFYWKPRGDDKEYAALGALLAFDEIPKITVKNRSPACFYGGMQFYSSQQDDLWKSYPQCYFFLPEWEIIQDHEKTEVRHHQFTNKNSSFNHAQYELKIPNTKALKRNDYPDHQLWKDLVQKALIKIRDQEFKKVVLARRSSFQTRVNAYALLSQIQKKTQTSSVFAFQHHPESVFIGSTPEFLYERSDRFFSTEAIAGTRDRSNLQGKQDLLIDPKDLEEVAIVKDDLKKKLSSFATLNPDNPETADVITTSHLHHLRFSLKGILNQSMQDAELISLLHPTPAINGYPTQKALEFILEHEPFTRGHYSGPIGCISEKKTQLAVGIRSCLVEQDLVHLFSGAGIVEKSDPDQEWEELESKIKQFKEWICL